jgi:hypothetical protein
MYCQPFVLQGFGDNIAGESLFPLQVCHALVPLLSAAPFCVCKINFVTLSWSAYPNLLGAKTLCCCRGSLSSYALTKMYSFVHAPIEV